MMDEEESEGWWKHGATFVAHIAVATLVLIVIGAAAYGIFLFIQLLKTHDAPESIIGVFTGLENFVFVVDAGVFIAYVLATGCQFICHLTHITWRPRWLVLREAKQPESWWRPGASFAGHVLAASLVCVVMGAAAFGLAEFAHFLESKQAPWLIVTIFYGLETFVLWVDVVIYVIYVLTTAWKFVLSVTRIAWKPTWSTICSGFTKRFSRR
ncbi:hypothetical protein ABC383_22600 [Noviherbaspirillum sp. 1P10PC]|uniref:hypothetical protein n=1 Tax=Noviherbaspirillum sp. 1P10PC TaxID=3132292 RepID=UPI0039A1868D